MCHGIRAQGWNPGKSADLSGPQFAHVKQNKTKQNKLFRLSLLYQACAGSTMCETPVSEGGKGIISGTAVCVRSERQAQAEPSIGKTMGSYTWKCLVKVKQAVTAALNFLIMQSDNTC